MPFRIDDSVISLEGHCSIEEAQPLFDALREVDEPTFDLAAMTTVHTAVVQLILASAGTVRGLTPDPLLEACLRGSLLA
jgi:hypothetical protein